MEEAFEKGCGQLKEALTKTPVLVLPNPGVHIPFILMHQEWHWGAYS